MLRVRTWEYTLNVECLGLITQTCRVISYLLNVSKMLKMWGVLNLCLLLFVYFTYNILLM